jgi:hypothetical protein
MKSRRLILLGLVAEMEKRIAYELLVGMPEGKKSIGRPI